MSKALQIKNSFIYLVPVIVGNVLPIITLPIFTTVLSPADYGVLALTGIYAIFVNGIANFGLTVGYERNFFESGEENRISGLLYTTVVFILTAFIFFGIVTYIFRETFSRWITGSPENSTLLFWSYLATGLTGLKTYFLTYFKNTENAKLYIWYTIDENLLTVGFSLVLVMLIKTGPIGIVWGQLISSLIVFLVLSLRFLRSIPFRIDIPALKDSLRLSLPLTPKIFFGIIGTQFDRYMIGLLNTIGGVGIYNLGQKISNIVFVFMTAIQNVFGPQVYKRMFDLGEEGKKSIGSYLTPFLYISVLIGLLISLFSEEMILILTPETFHGAIDVTIILSMLYVTYFFGKQPQLIYAKKTYISSLLTLLTIAFNILLNIPLIKIWGVIGAAWGTFISGMCTGIITFYLSQKYYDIKWEYSKVGIILMIFFLSSMTMIILRYISVEYIYRLVFKFIALATYVVLGVKIDIITRENFDSVKKVILPASNKSSVLSS